MKKTYIEPANTVVKLNPVKMIADSVKGTTGAEDLNVSNEGTGSGGVYSADSRESLNVWEEW